MSQELILITGISGFIGYETLVVALRSGYRARGVVRRQYQIENIKKALSDPKLLANVEFVIVEDLLAKDAFDDLVKDVKYILHIASPMPYPTDNFLRDYYRPAIDMTLNVLSAGLKSSSVKRIVITSSNVPFIPIDELMSGTGKLSKPVFKSDDEIPHYDINIQIGHPYPAYGASKSMAIEAAEEFMKKEKPAYDLVVMMPTTVLGADGLATSPKRLEEGSNGLLMNYILGKGQMPLLRTTVLIDDVAKAHVMAVNPSIPAGRYFLSSEGVEGTNFPEAFGILKKHFPEAYGTTFAKKADALYIEMGIDTEKTEKTFGFQFKSFEDQVKSVVENYLKLLPK